MILVQLRSRYVFLEFASKEEAIAACRATNGYALDKQHVFAVNLFNDFEKYAMKIMILCVLLVVRFTESINSSLSSKYTNSPSYSTITMQFI